MAGKKVLVLGLDCVPAHLLFGPLTGRMPNLERLMRSGASGTLESSDPPITIPAWMVMMTGKSPGRLGLYGFRHRRNNSYTEISLPTADSVSEPAVWDLLAEHGKKSCVIGVPPGYPPRAINGWRVSCFMTPSTEGAFTYPEELKDEIQEVAGPYIPDVTFRVEDRDTVLQDLYTMTARRFKAARHLLKTKPWDFFMLHEIGPDRLQHAFWKYYDTGHHLYEPGNRFESAIPDYYEFLDRQVGELLELVDDDTAILVLSDHGAKRMRGAFCVNEWLEQEGYLVFKQRPEGQTSLEDADVDWANTIAWAWGGYYARIFLNVKGREADGVIEPGEYEEARNELRAALCSVKGPDGESWDTRVAYPEELYDVCNGDYPDMMVYFDDLYWRAAGTVGHSGLYLGENDTGPDDSVHSRDGIYILADGSGRVEERGYRSLYDVAPTILRLMDTPVPAGMTGRGLEP